MKFSQRLKKLTLWDCTCEPLLKWMSLTWFFFLYLFNSYFCSSIFLNIFSFKLWPVYPEVMLPYFLTLPSTKLSHSLHLVGIMAACHKKVYCEIQSIATQRKHLSNPWWWSEVSVAYSTVTHTTVKHKEWTFVFKCL